MRRPRFLRPILQQLAYSGFDFFRLLGLKNAIFLVAVAECRLFRTGYYHSIFFYCYRREEFELCDRLMEAFIAFYSRKRPPHRVAKPQKNFGTPEHELKKSMQYFFETANASGFQPFIAFGTLLGYARERKFIPWDKDLDIGLFYDETDVAKLVQILKDAGFVIIEYTGKAFPCKVKCRLKNYPPIDIVFFKKEGEKLLTFGRLGNGKTMIRKRTPFRLTDAVFYDVPVRIPENPEVFLTENYGDWKTPKKIYHYILDSKLTDYSTPNINYLAMVVFLAHLQRNNEQAVAHYLNLFTAKMPEERLWVSIKEKLNACKYLH